MWKLPSQSSHDSLNMKQLQSPTNVSLECSQQGSFKGFLKNDDRAAYFGNASLSASSSGPDMQHIRKVLAVFDIKGAQSDSTTSFQPTGTDV